MRIIKFTCYNITDIGWSSSEKPIYFRFVHLIRFSAKVLTALCEQIEAIPISGVIVVGDGQAARSIALSGNAMKVPVLWAKGGLAQLHSGGSEVRINPDDILNFSQSVEVFCCLLFMLNTVLSYDT